MLAAEEVERIRIVERDREHGILYTTLELAVLIVHNPSCQGS